MATPPRERPRRPRVSVGSSQRGQPLRARLAKYHLTYTEAADAILNASHVGYCSKTEEGLGAEFTDCELGQKGVLGPLSRALWQAGEVVSLRACVEHCSRCQRCRYFSFSQQWRDCSWYRSCDLKSLHKDVANFQTFKMPASMHINTSRIRRAKAEGRNRRQALLIGARGGKGGGGGKDRGGGISGGGGGGSSDGWAWFQPVAAMHVAILLFGKVGTLEEPPSWVGADRGDRTIARLARESLRANVIDANPHSTHDVFVHTWNPSLGGHIDALYRPAWSSHEPERHGITKVLSASLSLAAVLRAKQASERKAQRRYDLVAAMRLDVLFLVPLVWARLPRAQLWLPSQCCRPDHGGGRVPRSLETAYETMKEECTGEGLICDLCTTSRFLRMGNGDREMALEAEYNYYVNDWLLLAPSATADTWSALAERPGAYTDALKEVGIHTTWMHFFWAAHLHHALRASAGVQPCLEAGRELVLVRFASKGRYCQTNVSVAASLPSVRGPVWGGMQRALCPSPGRVSCPWQSHRCAATAVEGARAAFGRGDG